MVQSGSARFVRVDRGTRLMKRYAVLEDRDFYSGSEGLGRLLEKKNYIFQAVRSEPIRMKPRVFP